jgi:uncharacterized repeat protein (TIGR01451 family)
VGFVANATGIWHWVATYNGDSNNNSVSSGPLDEPVSIPEQADLVIVKTVSNPRPTVGRPVIFTFVIGNNGPNTATNVIVHDPFPPGLIVIDSGTLRRLTRKQRQRLRWPPVVFRVHSATPSQGTYDPAAGVWQVGTLAPGARAVLQVVALVQTAGPLVNTATVAGLQFDPNLSNNLSGAALIALRSPGSISKRLFLASSMSATLRR